jgi:polyferredoxin
VARIAAVVLGALLAYRAASLAAADPAARLGYAVLLGLGGLCALWGFHALGRSIGHAGVSDALHRRARYLKYALLAAAVSGYAATGSDRVLSFDPLAVAFAAAPDAWTVALMAVLLLFSLDYYRAWCRYLCPVGALLLLGNKLGLLLGLARPKRYRRCDLGVRSREDFDCLQCNRCLDAQASSTRCRARPRWEGSSHGNGKRGLPLVAPEAADHAMARPGGAS